MSKSNFCQKDKATFDKLQQLKIGVDFISNLNFATDKQRVVAEKVKYLIENIDSPEHRKDWCVSLDIFDVELQTRRRKNGVYWRQWLMNFENNELQIIAESKHSSKVNGHYGNDFSYFASIYFGDKDVKYRIQFDEDIYEFMQDLKNYQKYITDTLNELEINIEVF